jgi:hypothetical protein
MSGMNRAGSKDVHLYVIVVYCQVDVSATGRSLVQRHNTLGLNVIWKSQQLGGLSTLGLSSD